MTKDEKILGKVIDRVKKILARANDMTGTTEEERNTAMKMAHSLLVKYNLSVHDTEEIDNNPREANFFEENSYPWMRATLEAISDLYFCKYFWIKRPIKEIPKDVHYFVGLNSNVQTAMIIGKFVIDGVKKEVLKKKVGRKDEKVFIRSFCLAAAVRIVQRCRALKEDAEKENSNPFPGTGLVLASYYNQEQLNNQDFILKNMKIKLDDRERNINVRTMSRDGWQAGTEYGSKVPLNRQIEGQ